MKAVIPAAGLGTRMLPATKAVPKELLPVALKPLIQYAVEEAVAAGIETVVIVTRSGMNLIRQHFGEDRNSRILLADKSADGFDSQFPKALSTLPEIRFVEQARPLGLAHAVSCARPIIGNEPFLVLLPDEIVVADELPAAQIVKAYCDGVGSIIAVREIESFEVERHGIVRPAPPDAPVRAKFIRLAGLVEKPDLNAAPSRIGVFGRYVLEPSIWRHIEKTPPDSAGEFQLTDAINSLCQDSRVYGYFFDGVHYDVGNPIGYFKANLGLSSSDPEMRQILLESCSAAQRGRRRERTGDKVSTEASFADVD